MRFGKKYFLLFLIIIFSFSCSKTETQRNGNTSGETPLAGTIRLGQGAQGEGSAESDLPDLAETIARLSRETEGVVTDREAFIEDFWRWIFGEAGIPEKLARNVATSVLESPDFVMELLILLQEDPYTYYLVDKQNALPDGYEPDDLVPLTGGSYRISREGLMLRKIAVEALEEMSAAAATDGIILTAG